MKGSKVLSVFIVVLVMFSFIGCGKHTTTDVSVEEENTIVLETREDYNAAQASILEQIDNEPENVALKDELSQLYREEALLCETVSDAQSCFDSAKAYDDGFEYTVEEVNFLAEKSLSNNEKTEEILTLCTDMNIKGDTHRVDELTYLELSEAYIDTLSEEDAYVYLDELVKADNYSEISVFLKGMYEQYGKIDINFDFEKYRAEAEQAIATYEGAFAGVSVAYEKDEYAEVDYVITVCDENGYAIYRSYAEVCLIDVFDAVYTYDEQKRFVQITGTDKEATIAYQFDYTYDENGNLSVIMLNGEPLEEYFYDENERLTMMRDHGRWANWEEYYKYTDNWHGGIDKEVTRIDMNTEQESVFYTLFIDKVYLENGTTIDMNNNYDCVTVRFPDGHEQFISCSYYSPQFETSYSDTEYTIKISVDGAVVEENVYQYDENGLPVKAVCNHINYEYTFTSNYWNIYSEDGSAKICIPWYWTEDPYSEPYGGLNSWQYDIFYFAQ